MKGESKMDSHVNDAGTNESTGNEKSTCTVCDELYITNEDGCPHCMYNQEYHVKPVLGAVITGVSCTSDGIHALEITKDGKKHEITIDFGKVMGHHDMDLAFLKIKEIE
jgi:hypothetical protein